MTVNPADLVAVRAYCAEQTGQPLVALGIAGDDAHAESGGYHIGGSLVPTWDYSRAESLRDRTRTTPAASAFDLGGNFRRSLEITRGIVAACQAGDPRTRDIREVIYTPDGQTVRRWDRLGVRTGGDSSHLSHTHVSFFRDSEGRRHLDDNFLGLLKSLFTGGASVTASSLEADVPLTNEDVMKIWTWDLQDGPGTGMAYQLVNQIRDELRAAADAEKVRDAAEATATAGLKAALDALIKALTAGGTGTVLDTAAVLAKVEAEAAKTRDLVERRYVDEMAARDRDHKAEIAGLLAELKALQGDAPVGQV